jgi:hypothetical protein
VRCREFDSRPWHHFETPPKIWRGLFSSEARQLAWLGYRLGVMPRLQSVNCGKCGGLKHRLSSGATRCRNCHNRQGREYYRASSARRENMRRTYVLRKYGISFQELEDLLQRHSERCAICRRPWTQCVSAKRSRYDARFLQYLCVDHDHATGKVRGLLCNGCNTAIGMFQEDAARLAAAAEYLARRGG